jgi:hypothetical protein
MDCCWSTAVSRSWHPGPTTLSYLSARVTALAIILSRSLRNAFLLSLSRSAGIAANADSIAMSFASARFTFNCCSSFSILSKLSWLRVESDIAGTTDADGMSGILTEVKTINSSLGVCIVAHIHNSTSGTQTRYRIGRNFNRVNQAKLPEHGFKIRDCGRTGHIPNM